MNIRYCQINCNCDIMMMDSAYNISYNSFEDSSPLTSRRDITISDELADICERMRISSLTKAAEISPHVKEVTIGPNSPLKKEVKIDLTSVIKKEAPEESVIDEKVYEDRCSLITKEYAQKIKEITNEYLNSLIKNMLINQATMTSKHWEKQSNKCDRQIDSKARKLQMLKCYQENDNLYLLEKARSDERDCPIVTTRTIENMSRILEEQHKATARIVAVIDSHAKISNCYNDILSILNNESLGKAACEKYMVSINTVISNINNIMNIGKTGVISDKDVKHAEISASNIDNIQKKIHEDLNTLKNEEIMKMQKEEELAKRKELEEKKAQEIEAAQMTVLADEVKTEQPARIKPQFFSSTNHNKYEELKIYLEKYEAQYNDLLQDVNQKKFRFDCQKAVNTPVNALSSVSSLHMRDKYDKLAKLLNGEKVKVLDVYVQATQHPQGLAYCTALLAKKIVRQGDLLVSSNTEAAYPLAAVTVALWSQFPHFGKLVEAYFHRLCPYLVPMYLPLKEGQSDKDFYLSRGYTYNDGVIEKQDKFLKRMSGIFRLHCAIWTAKMPKFLNTQHPQDLRYGWQWLASFINLKPEVDISATLLHDFYIMCGSTFNKYYGKQFWKILELTNTEYLKILENIDEGGPKTRLEVYLQTVLKSNDIPAPPPSAQQINW